MVSLETIEREISELETRETTYATCERLAWLYIVRDHLHERVYPSEGKAALESALSGSDFLEAANGRPYEDVMRVVDEHMETIRTLYPKTYDSIVERIRQLG